MAQCERCLRGGYMPTQMHADQSGTKLLGPCCSVIAALPAGPVAPEEEAHYGIEVSNSGLRAFFNWKGLSIEFNRTPDELKAIAAGIG